MIVKIITEIQLDITTKTVCNGLNITLHLLKDVKIKIVMDSFN